MSKTPTARCRTRNRHRARCAIMASRTWGTSFGEAVVGNPSSRRAGIPGDKKRSEEHTSELQSRENLVCRLLLEKKKMKLVIVVCATMNGVDRAGLLYGVAVVDPYLRRVVGLYDVDPTLGFDWVVCLPFLIRYEI